MKNLFNRKIIGIGVFVLAAAILLGWVAWAEVGVVEKLTFRTADTSYRDSSPQELYSKFACPCCGDPLDQCDCEQSQSRKQYIDSLFADGGPDGDPVLQYAREYGPGAIRNEQLRRTYRKKLAARASDSRPEIELSPRRRDLGSVSAENGVVKTTFELKNTGDEPLEIKRVASSCGCTTASVSYQDRETPRFSSRGKPRSSYSPLKIPPSESGTLNVFYDPNYHSEFSGRARRIVKVYSNDPEQPARKVLIELYQEKPSGG